MYPTQKNSRSEGVLDDDEVVIVHSNCTYDHTLALPLLNILANNPNVHKHSMTSSVPGTREVIAKQGHTQVTPRTNIDYRIRSPVHDPKVAQESLPSIRGEILEKENKTMNSHVKHVLISVVVVLLGGPAQ